MPVCPALTESPEQLLPVVTATFPPLGERPAPGVGGSSRQLLWPWTADPQKVVSEGPGKAPWQLFGLPMAPWLPGTPLWGTGRIGQTLLQRLVSWQDGTLWAAVLQLVERPGSSQGRL